jgi:hypothetical protein
MSHQLSHDESGRLSKFKFSLDLQYTIRTLDRLFLARPLLGCEPSSSSTAHTHKFSSTRRIQSHKLKHSDYDVKMHQKFRYYHQVEPVIKLVWPCSASFHHKLTQTPSKFKLKVNLYLRKGTNNDLVKSI